MSPMHDWMFRDALARDRVELLRRAAAPVRVTEGRGPRPALAITVGLRRRRARRPGCEHGEAVTAS